MSCVRVFMGENCKIINLHPPTSMLMLISIVSICHNAVVTCHVIQFMTSFFAWLVHEKLDLQWLFLDLIYSNLIIDLLIFTECIHTAV